MWSRGPLSSVCCRLGFALGLVPPDWSPCILSCSRLVCPPQRDLLKFARGILSLSKGLPLLLGRRPSPDAAHRHCSVWLRPVPCLSPVSPTCPPSPIPSSLRLFPAASPGTSLYLPLTCQVAAKCHSKTPLDKARGPVPCGWPPPICPSFSPSAFIHVVAWLPPAPCPAPRMANPRRAGPL